MGCQGVPSVRAIFEEADERWPRRNHASDGICASAQHHAQNPTSDHEPDERGLAHAGDLTHDPDGGPDCAVLAEQLRRGRDPRIRYVIFAGRYFLGPWSDGVLNGKRSPWVWLPYDGPNPHDKHMHVSVGYRAAAEIDTRSWFGGAAQGGLRLDADVKARFDTIDRDLATIKGKVEAGYNLTAEKAGTVLNRVVAAVGASRDSVLGALTTLPPPDVDEDQVAAKVKELLDAQGVDVDPQSILDALRANPLAPINRP